ncbi:MAG TPA: hypothetical protein VGO55_04890, partial [Allosphingosinicella sp.]|nr:hypothetical protein [Allosphingosinicella sp.]
MTKTLLRAGALSCALLASTALTAPALAQELPRYNQLDSNGVDLVTGEFSFSLPEGSIGSGPGALTLMRNWAGSAGWTDNWSGILYSDTEGSVVVEFGTYADRFTVSGPPLAFTSTKSDGATLEILTDSYRYRSRDGTTIIFKVVDLDYDAEFHGPVCDRGGGSGCGIPVQIQRPDGMTYTLNWDLERRQQGGIWFTYPRFRGVANSANYSFTVNYATNTPGSGEPVANWYVRTGAQFTNLDGAPASLPTATYSAVSSTVLDVTDIAGDTWRLTTAPTAIGIRRPGSGSDDVSATLSSGLVTQVVNDGVTTGYSRSVSGSTVTTTATLIDGDGGTTDPQTVVVADSDVGRITSVTDPLSHQTSFQYDGSGRLTRTTAPEGNYTAYGYDGRGNLTETRAVAKSGSGLPDMVMTASYDSTCSNVVTCNQPNSVTDARGNTTNLTYDSTHGGVLTVTAPAPGGSGDRPQTRLSYTQVTAVTGQPVYLQTGVSACASGTS